MSEDAKKEEGGGEASPEPQAAEAEGLRATAEREGECRCTIHVEADAENLKARYEKSLAALKEQAAVPGFRAGKAPLTLVARRFANRIKADVLSSAMEEGYDKAVQDNELTVVAETDKPDVEQMSWDLGEGADFTVRCEVLPALAITDELYKGLSIAVPRLEPTDELFEQEMKLFARQLGRWEKLEAGTIQDEDYVRVEVSVPGEGDEPLWNGELEFYPRMDRVGPFEVKGLAEAAVGKGEGDSIGLVGKIGEAGLKEADDALQALVGQTVNLTAKVIEIFRMNAPQIDDALAKKLGMEDAEQVRGFVRSRLEKRLEEDKSRAAEGAVTKALLEKVDPEMPATLVRQATQDEQRRLVAWAIRHGMNLSQAQEAAQQNAERAEESAVRKLKLAFLLQKIADLERVYVLDEEVKEVVRAMGAREGWSETKAWRYVHDNDLEKNLRDEMRSDKVVKLLIDSAQVEEIEPEEFKRRMGASGGEQDEGEPQGQQLAASGD